MKDPWIVQSVVLSEDTSRTDLKVGFRTGRKVRCPECEKWCDVHDRIQKTWRHPDICNSVCYVTADIPRSKCEKCGVLQLKTPWAREYVSYTKEFEAKAVDLLRSMPISKVAETLRVGRWVLEGIISHYVNSRLDKMDLSNVSRIFLDETSSKRGHRNITVIADADTKEIIFMAEDKGFESVQNFLTGSSLKW